MNKTLERRQASWEVRMKFITWFDSHPRYVVFEDSETLVVMVVVLVVAGFRQTAEWRARLRRLMSLLVFTHLYMCYIDTHWERCAYTYVYTYIRIYSTWMRMIGTRADTLTHIRNNVQLNWNYSRAAYRRTLSPFTCYLDVLLTGTTGPRLVCARAHAQKGKGTYRKWQGAL